MLAITVDYYMCVIYNMSKTRRYNKRSQKRSSRRNRFRKMQGGSYNEETKEYKLYNQGITTFPDNIPIATEKLILRSNSISVLPPEKLHFISTSDKPFLPSTLIEKDSIKTGP